MLEALRGKRMMFVGDSLNRGQFESMICLLNSIIPPNASSFHTKGSLSVFTAKVRNSLYEYMHSDDRYIFMYIYVGIQCNGGILLGAIPSGVEFR